MSTVESLSTGTHHQIPNDLTETKQAILRAMYRCLIRDERDLLEGGVSSHAIADCGEVDVSVRTVQDHMWELADNGYIELVWGANPENGKARRSYLPPEHPDAGTPDSFR